MNPTMEDVECLENDMRFFGLTDQQASRICTVTKIAKRVLLAQSQGGKMVSGEVTGRMVDVGFENPDHKDRWALIKRWQEMFLAAPDMLAEKEGE